MKRTFSIIFVVVILISTMFSSTAFAGDYQDVVEKDGVMQMGDFTSLVDGFLIYYPVGLEESETTYPVAVWANGTMCAPIMYYDILVGVAKAGYIVIASPEMMSKDGKAQIAAVDYILERNEDAESPFYGKVDTAKIGAFGHSQGGLSSVNAAVADDRIGAIVSIAGASTDDQTKNLKVPSLFLAGTSDAIVMPSLWVKPSYEGCPAPAVYAALKNGVHTACTIYPEPYINYSVKWFNVWLGNGGDISVFEEGGELSQDPEWKGYMSKNLDANLSGTMLGTGMNIWLLVGMVVLAAIVCAIIVIAKKRKGTKVQEKN